MFDEEELSYIEYAVRELRFGDNPNLLDAENDQYWRDVADGARKSEVQERILGKLKV
jgi:hypothetical protein